MKYSDTQLIRATFTKTHDPLGVRVCEENLDEIRSYKDCDVVTDVDEGTIVIVTNREGALEVGLGDWIFEDSLGHHYPIADDEVQEAYTPVK